MKCENCNNSHNGEYGSGRFCSVKCSRSFSTKNKREEINRKVSLKTTGRLLSEFHKKQIERGNNFNRKPKIIRHCLNCNILMECRPSDTRKFCKQMCWVAYTEKHKDSYILYRQQSNFDFDPYDFPDKFDLSLIESHGKYSPSNRGNNLNGISKDHMLSVKDGFVMGVSPDIIKHPANCKLMLHKDNQKKNRVSSITLAELLERISKW